MSVPAWQAVFAPAKTPREIVDRLAREVTLALQDPAVRGQYEQQTFQITGSTPQTLAAVMKEGLRTWEQFIRENDIPKE
jgi:tripartite-type tricarboxylate transporter receptor subunit TctC